MAKPKTVRPCCVVRGKVELLPCERRERCFFVVFKGTPSTNTGTEYYFCVYSSVVGQVGPSLRAGGWGKLEGTTVEKS